MVISVIFYLLSMHPCIRLAVWVWFIGSISCSVVVMGTIMPVSPFFSSSQGRRDKNRFLTRIHKKILWCSISGPAWPLISEAGCYFEQNTQFSTIDDVHYGTSSPVLLANEVVREFLLVWGKILLFFEKIRKNGLKALLFLFSHV